MKAIERLTWLALAAAAAAGCRVKDPLFCDATHPCTDPTRPFCDTTGQYDPDHNANTCIAQPGGADGGGGDAMGLVDAAPGTIGVDVANDRFFVRTDGSVSAAVTISRGAGVTGDVTIDVPAPPTGVTFDALTIPDGSNDGVLVAHAATDAPFARSSVMVEAAAGMVSANDTLDLEVIGKPGDLDTTFGTAGMTILPGTSNSDTPVAMFDQAGKLVVFLWAKQANVLGAYATRLLDDGGTDTTFGTSGAYFESFSSVGITGGLSHVVAGRQSTGEFVILGSGNNGADHDLVIVRLTAGGQIDSAVPPHRIDMAATNDDVRGVAIGPQDQIQIVGTTGTGSTALLLERLGVDGALDTTFGGGRVTLTPASGNQYVSGASVVQPDGQLVLTLEECGTLCSTQYLVRYSAAGAADATFGTNGMLGPAGTATVVAQLQDTSGGAFRALGANDAGIGAGSMAVWQFAADGTPDDQYGTSGLYAEAAPAMPAIIVSAVEPTDGGIIGAGWEDTGLQLPEVYHAKLLKLDATGAPDTSFGPAGETLDTSADFRPYVAVIRADHRLSLLGRLKDFSSSAQVVVRRYFW